MWNVFDKTVLSCIYSRCCHWLLLHLTLCWRFSYYQRKKRKQTRTELRFKTVRLLFKSELHAAKQGLWVLFTRCKKVSYPHKAFSRNHINTKVRLSLRDNYCTLWKVVIVEWRSLGWRQPVILSLSVLAGKSFLSLTLSATFLPPSHNSARWASHSADEN